ncbi:MAG: alkaline shock response membrane anchor protein AmaP [Acetivibrionales bacterium]|jgi:uncharacterized alkaline shock family protein YloU
MNIIFRILLAIYAFSLMVLSAFIMAVTIKPAFLDVIYFYFSNDVLSSKGSTIVMFIIAFIFFLISLVFLLSGLKSGRNKKSVGRQTNIGEINISLSTIESIVLAASKRVSGIKETRANVYKKDDKVSIVVSMIVYPEINIPELSESMQEKVKKEVEDISGVSVSDVKIVVENIHAGSIIKQRVE